MRVTIKIDDELRKKQYWKNVPDTEEFEFLRYRDEDGAVLKDRQNRMVLCSRDRIIFPGREIPMELVEEIIPEPFGDGI